MEYTWFVLLLALSITALMLLLLQGTKLGDLVHDRIPDRPRRRLFAATVSFFLTFAGVRGVVYCITHNIPPFHFIEMRGRHIHHLVIGILMLLAVGMPGFVIWGSEKDGLRCSPAACFPLFMEWARRSRLTNSRSG